MLVRALLDCPRFTAGDATELRELLHPDKADLALRYSLAHAVVPAGKRSLPHVLDYSEVYYVLSGTARMHVDDEVRAIGPGDTVYIPPHATQYVENTGSTEFAFLCIVDPAWQPDIERVV
ncbi:MAG: cupin domain-containing protein [Bacteroidota bacterium]